eukprot:PhM_4_TR2091/c2_g1_i2/m.35933
MGGAILSSHSTHLGDEMLKLRALMIDGCPVNAVAAAYVNDAFLEVQKRHEALGDADWFSSCLIEDALGTVSEDVKQACSSVQMFSGDMYKKVQKLFFYFL